MRLAGPTLFFLTLHLLVCRFTLAHSIPLPARDLDDSTDSAILIGDESTTDQLALPTPDPVAPPAEGPTTDAEVLLDPSMTATTTAETTTDQPVLLPTSDAGSSATDAEVLMGPPTTVTVPANATVTNVITVFVSSPTSTPSSTISPTTSSTDISPDRSSPSGSQWAAPPRMSDMSSFNISKFSTGSQNFRLVDGIPAHATAASSSSSTSTPTSTDGAGILGLVNGIGGILQASPSPTPHKPFGDARYTTWNNQTTAMQVVYPAGSANPSATPQGGAQFYASPIPLQSAQVVTLAYSVFFPDGFDWVHGGKLPGLYGGKMGCSGGDAAVDCFSTRLMWREDGQGELYLYAEKDKQTQALCADPQSECNAQYGFSIGRGSFYFATGMWTYVAQTVKLNTPGEQNGEFTLVVNGVRVIHRTDIFYRDAPSGSARATSTTTVSPTTTQGGLVGLIPLLGPLVGAIARRTVDVVPFSFVHPTTAAKPPQVFASGQGFMLFPDEPANDTTTTTMTPVSDQAAQKPTKPVGFSGIFFSTFFGGHGDYYTTPVDQYAWFKDFSLTSDT
ncbi:hypothetical protein HMN09_00111000 [Mycena chlorophos]|uniref:Polysaccharide lyase 14 domain-containing protein n=1 Tax=Mycena chlorophos TaxID=658473 RepID=A0A8H6TUZ4_MYCCL|nr:hypothetical protein HMN09_00111000 [Mycena chlorophos]